MHLIVRYSLSLPPFILRVRMDGWEFLSWQQKEQTTKETIKCTHNPGLSDPFFFSSLAHNDHYIWLIFGTNGILRHELKYELAQTFLLTILLLWTLCWNIWHWMLDSPPVLRSSIKTLSRATHRRRLWCAKTFFSAKPKSVITQ